MIHVPATAIALFRGMFCLGEVAGVRVSLGGGGGGGGGAGRRNLHVS